MDLKSEGFPKKSQRSEESPFPLKLKVVSFVIPWLAALEVHDGV
jgi:hypothetical protein